MINEKIMSLSDYSKDEMQKSLSHFSKHLKKGGMLDYTLKSL